MGIPFFRFFLIIFNVLIASPEMSSGVWTACIAAAAAADAAAAEDDEFMLVLLVFITAAAAGCCCCCAEVGAARPEGTAEAAGIVMDHCGTGVVGRAAVGGWGT